MNKRANRSGIRRSPKCLWIICVNRDFGTEDRSVIVAHFRRRLQHGDARALFARGARPAQGGVALADHEEVGGLYLPRLTHAAANRRSSACASAASALVTSPAGRSQPSATAWPHHSGEKSPEPEASALARRGASAPAASGNAGATSLTGPTSRIKRLMMPRAGRPVIRLVSTVESSVAEASAGRWAADIFASGQRR